MVMDKAALIDDLTSRLGEQKNAFLRSLQSDVRTFIENQGKDCLTLIERRSSGDQRWSISADLGYIRRLIAFCREKDFSGNQLDSALTEPVIDRISGRFGVFYAEHEKMLGETLASYLITNPVLAAALVDGVVGTAAHALSEGAKQKLATVLMQPLKEVAAQVLGSTTAQAAGQAVTAAVKSSAAHMSLPVATKIAMLLAHSLSLTMKTAISKVLASTALKAVIAAAVKKFLVTALVAAIVKLVAAKFGIATLGSFVLVLIPLIAAYIVYEVITFPKTLGEKVSVKVVGDLRESFDAINRSAMESVVSDIFANGVGAIGAELGKSKPVQELLAELLREAP